MLCWFEAVGLEAGTTWMRRLLQVEPSLNQTWTYSEIRDVGNCIIHDEFISLTIIPPRKTERKTQKPLASHIEETRHVWKTKHGREEVGNNRVKSSPTVGKVMGLYLKTVHVNGGQNLSRPHAVTWPPPCSYVRGRNKVVVGMTQSGQGATESSNNSRQIAVAARTGPVWLSMISRHLKVSTWIPFWIGQECQGFDCC